MPDRSRRPPMLPRQRRRWTAAAVIVAAWLLLSKASRSVIEATVLLGLLTALAFGTTVVARQFGVDLGQVLASRPWRSGEDVWRAALRHLPETFLIAPDRVRLAPAFVELRMNPDDLADLAQSIDLEVVATASSEAYRAQILKHQARVAGPGQPGVTLVSDEELARGRYQFSPRAGSPRTAAVPVTPGHTLVEKASEPTVTEAEHVPLLRLVTMNVASETRKSGAKAGRGVDVELQLPDVPTISRVHAEFTFKDGHWWICNRGSNGLRLDGRPLTGEYPLADGDSIQWGGLPEAPVSQVQII